MFAIEILSSMVGQSLKNSHATKSLADLLFWVVQTVVNIGLIKVALKFYDHQKADLKDLYDHYPLFLKYILGTFLYGIIVALGIIVLIIPGIIFAVKLQFVPYLIIDKGLGPIEALQKSWALTKDNGFNLFLLGLLLVLINILGALALGIGLFWTVPTTWLATVFVYRKLSPKSS